MKLNQLILAVVLFASVTATQSAQAWDWWDLCPSPIIWIGAYVRSRMPITTAKLNEFKQEQIASTDRHFDTLSARAEQRQAATDAGFVTSNAKQTAMEVMVDSSAVNVANARRDLTQLKDITLPNAEKTLSAKMKELAEENELLKRQIAEQGQTNRELAEAQLKSEREIQDLTKQIVIARQKLAGIKAKTKQSAEQVQEQTISIAGISGQLKSLTGSESIIKQGLGQYMQNAMNPTTYLVSNTQKLH